MNFGQALGHIRGGGKVARAGWNGKGMYLFLARGARAMDTIIRPAPHAVLVSSPEPDLPICDAICMRTAQSTIVVGWLASQTDMMADDWGVVP